LARLKPYIVKKKLRFSYLNINCRGEGTDRMGFEKHVYGMKENTSWHKNIVVPQYPSIGASRTHVDTKICRYSSLLYKMV
jgi:hypothetical protein